MRAQLVSLFRALFRRPEFESAMEEELSFHVEKRAADLERSGMPRRDALRQARLELGSVNTVKDECRTARGLYLFDELTRQVRYALRLLRNAPAFTATVVLTIALCLGANLAIFSVVDAILVRPLPFPDAGRLVTIFNTYPKAGVGRDGSSLTNYYERRNRIPAFSSLSIYRFGTAIVGPSGATERVDITQVSPEFFATLGTGPRLGRVFREEETSYETDRVVILSDNFWRRYYNASPNIVGRKITIGGVSWMVAGILPRGFRFLSSDSQLYFPLASAPEQRAPAQRHSGGNVIQMIARLKPGVNLAQAQAQIDAQDTALEADDPRAKAIAEAGFRSLVVPLHADHVATVRPFLLLLQAAVFLLLMVGAVNLANLVLIRATTRGKESAVRRALGASSGHIISEALSETLLLSLLGGLLGLIVGDAGVRLLVALGADRLPLGAHIAFPLRFLPLALGATVLLGILLAVPAAWFNIRHSLSGRLQSEGRTTIHRRAQRLRHGFLIAQEALSLVLLTGAGMLGLSLERLMAVSPGFRSDHILAGQISLPGKTYPQPQAQLNFISRLAEALSSQPGVTSVGVVTKLPFSGFDGKSAATVEGYTPRTGEPLRGHYSYGVAGNYFSAMGYTLIAGR